MTVDLRQRESTAVTSFDPSGRAAIEARADATTIADTPRRGLLARIGEAAPWRRITRAGRSTAAGGHFSGLIRSFLVFVGVPSLVMAFYLFAIAADQYVAEARFAVRGNVERVPSPDNLAQLNPVAVQTNSQDSFIVAGYIASKAIVEDLNRTLDLKKMFSRDEADIWARFDPSWPFEDLVEYWNRHVRATTDTISGVVTLQVRAFTREDALAIARAVVQKSEVLINELSRRNRADTLARASEELAKAEGRLREAQLAIQAFRNRSGLVDPVKSAESVFLTLVALRRDKLKVENDLTVLRRSVDESSRPAQQLIAEIRALDEQMAKLQSQLTGGAGGSVASQTLLEYEGLMIEKTFAEKLYAAAQAIQDRARIDTERQQIYLATFVPPSLPEDTLYPRRWSTLFVSAFVAFLLWSIGMLVVAGVNDHRI